MAELGEVASNDHATATKAAPPAKPKQNGPKPPTRSQQLNKLYSLPAPLRTFPLPTLIPHNPLSLFHVLYVWLSQTVNRPSSHFETLYFGWFSPETRSIHVTDSRSIRGLWEQGFYGKGSLSRSEPSWLTREKARRGVSKTIASEDVTRKRRAERQQTKWERARKEREAIDQTLLQESMAADNGKINIDLVVDKPIEIEMGSGSPIPMELGSHIQIELNDPDKKLSAYIDELATDSDVSSTEPSESPVPSKPSTTVLSPVGPMELLALPNSSLGLTEIRLGIEISDDSSSHEPEISNQVVPGAAKISLAPVGPMELLALPNSMVELKTSSILPDATEEAQHSTVIEVMSSTLSKLGIHAAPVGPLELLALPNSNTDTTSHENLPDSNRQHEDVAINAHIDTSKPTETNPHTSSIKGAGIEDLRTYAFPKVNGSTVKDNEAANGPARLDDSSPHNSAPSTPQMTTSTTLDGSGDESIISRNATPTTTSTRRKSVRFSPTVERTTFLQSQPPSPKHAAKSTGEQPEANSKITLEETLAIEDQEHFQLTMEEAFFLSYGLGALTVLDPTTKSPISNKDLFQLFRKSSYFPPRSNPSSSTDDPFLISYVVYHHFRSLGWVVRGGTKFSVDYLLYNRGPVFSHAEFAVLILPSYSDPYWSSDPFLQNYVKGKQQRTWSWMHCVNRVITQVRKTLILVYVDIPAPLDAKKEAEIGVDGLLGKYKVREVILKRWSPNRSRD
ncbi:tRNA splicing endonuclease subunit sen2 [Clarireedia jacksonii]